jgi:hypothetical protein
MAKVEDTPENAAICKNNCISCMSHPGVEGEILYCSRGKSSTPIEKKGCNCSFCDVQIKYGCSGTFYCAEGACE